jgi:hypothetical protein
MMNALGSAGLLDNIVNVFSCKVKVDLHKIRDSVSYISSAAPTLPFRRSDPAFSLDHAQKKCYTIYW